MDIELLPTVSRWLHIGPVVIAIGGAVFQRFVLLPAALASLPEDQQHKLRHAVTARWRRFVHVCIALIFLSGLYNVYHHMAGADKPPVLYHLLLGIKLIAALGVFFIASALVGRSDAFVGFRAQAKKWLGLLIALATVIVLISGVMKNLPRHATPAGESPAVGTGSVGP